MVMTGHFSAATGPCIRLVTQASVEDGKPKEVFGSRQCHIADAASFRSVSSSNAQMLALVAT